MGEGTTELRSACNRSRGGGGGVGQEIIAESAVLMFYEAF